MELTKSFDPTPKLKSSPIPISFVSFNADDRNCIHCGDEYVKTDCLQYYCKKCLSCYLNNITDNNSYFLDVYISMKKKCSVHEISMTKNSQNTQECFRNCSEIAFFKQIHTDHSITSSSILEFEKYCRLCRKSMHQVTTKNLKFCSDCYLISSECIESTLTKKLTAILYLPWWLNINRCKYCDVSLKFTSDCQKYCGYCLTFYIGCRYCLTTNIVFGIANQSQCKKCKRISLIINDTSGNSDLNDFLVNQRLEFYNKLKIDKIKNIDNYFIPHELFDSIYKNCEAEILMEWIPYSQFTNEREVARGGFGIIYLATWLDGSVKDNYNERGRHRNETVILKKFKNSQDISKYFLNELKSNQHCYKDNHHLIKTYGFTKASESNDYILVMQYASGGDLHKWIQEKFTKITWNKEKLAILWQISEGLETIHEAEFIHRDFHSGNILFNLSNKKKYQWQIGDLGLSQPANNTSKSEIYGVIPYVAPEIFNGSLFSKKSDVYCMGMIMWEFTTGCKPFANVEHDINLILRISDGERPEITEDTPKCFADLMKSCWDPDPERRPSITEVRKTLSKWYHTNQNIKPFNQAETKRRELISLKKLGPEFSGKTHPSAIYTSRSLSPLISKYLFMKSSKVSIDYNSREQDFDIDFSGKSIDYNSRELDFDIDFSGKSKGYNSRELDFDIDFSGESNAPGIKRKSEEINDNSINSRENSGKSVKIGHSYL